MAYHKLGGLILALLVGSAHAGFVHVAPPPGFTQVGVDWWYTKAAANAATIAQNTVRTNAALNVGGRAVVIPVAARYAANAASVAAAGSWLIPAVIVGAAAVAAYHWFNTAGLEVENGVWIKRNSEEKCGPPDVCYEYMATSIGGAPLAPTYEKTISSALRAAIAQYHNGSWVVTIVTAAYPGSVVQFNSGDGNIFNNNVSIARRVIPPWDMSHATPVTQSEMAAQMANKPMPDDVPDALPFPLPVDDPVLNPDPALNPQTTRVSNGMPQRVPDSDPAEFKTPVVDLVPAPIEGDPWRLDAQPKDITSEDPTPLPDTEPLPAPDPANPNNPNNPKEKPKDDPFDLCQAHPEILACAELGKAPDAESLEEKTKDVNVTPMSGWGGGGTCPSAKVVHVAGRDVPIPFDLVCDFMSGLKPIILALAWLSAAMILIGARGGDS